MESLIVRVCIGWASRIEWCAPALFLCILYEVRLMDDFLVIIVAVYDY